MTWFQQTNLSDDLSGSEGIIKLWAGANYLESQNWRTNGNFSTDIFHYFFIPHNFYLRGSNTFAYHFPFKYIFDTIDVFHEGIQKSEPFWRLEPSSDSTATLETDIKTKLPYLIIPSFGQPNYRAVKCYFQPVGGKV